MSEALAGDPHKASTAAVAAEQLLENLSAEQMKLGVDTIAILASAQDWLGRSEEALRCAYQGRSAAIDSGNRIQGQSWRFRDHPSSFGTIQAQMGLA